MARPTSLFDILACPLCKVQVTRQDQTLHCPQCGQQFPIINGIPVMFPDGSVPDIQHEAELQIRDGYLPWVNRIILQSLLDDQLVLDVGAGNMALDDPCIIRMDVTLTPYVDVVGDLHALPFLPGSFDYIFSLAVFEHLRNPFQAAQEIYTTLKDGGYIYHECNFVFPYHGYPHHYFNATLQGMEQLFQSFTLTRRGVATYQMPSFALEAILRIYIQHSRANEFEHGRKFIRTLQEIISQDLRQYDIYFSEADALYVAAGTYITGYKQTSPNSSPLPPVLRNILENNSELKARFPDPNNLTDPRNPLLWAKQEGREQYPQLDTYLKELVPFHKRGPNATWDRSVVHGYPVEEAPYSAMGFPADVPLEENVKRAMAQYPGTDPKSLSIRAQWKALLWHTWRAARHRFFG